MVDVDIILEENYFPKRLKHFTALIIQLLYNFSNLLL